MQWSYLETNIAVRSFSSAILIFHDALNSLARGAMASSISSTPIEKFLVLQATRIKNIFSIGSTCSSRSNIFPPLSKIKFEILDTRPVLSLQDNNNMAVGLFSDNSFKFTTKHKLNTKYRANFKNFSIYI